MEGEIWQFAEEKLKPQTPEEKELWKKVERADKPIRTILKRMNRVLKKQFPEIDMQTLDTCSGHVKKDGSIEYYAVSPQFTYEKSEKTPAVYFRASIDKTTEDKKAEVKKILDDLFDQAILETNKVLGKESISKAEIKMEPGIDRDEKYALIISCEFILVEKKMAFEVLKNFWKNVEKA